MKYLKTFNQLIVEDRQFVERGDNVSLRTILMNIFKIFKRKEDLEEIFTNQDELEIATELYDSFIDTRELLELNEEELQSFADNLGVGGEVDVLVAIIEKLYNEKYKRNIKDDVLFCIKVLNQFIISRESSERIKALSKLYLTELEKIKDSL